jgi:catechol 2,3-dioxygenase-like lactoylglutathione lyase family enzyme
LNGRHVISRSEATRNPFDSQSLEILHFAQDDTTNQEKLIKCLTVILTLSFKVPGGTIMEKPRIRHIAINVEDLEKTAEYYKKVFGMEEKHRRPGGTIYLSDGHLDLALIHTEKYPWGIHHFGFKVDSVKEIEKIAETKAEDNTYGAIAESWIKDAEGNRVDVSEHGWPI